MFINNLHYSTRYEFKIIYLRRRKLLQKQMQIKKQQFFIPIRQFCGGMATVRKSTEFGKRRRNQHNSSPSRSWWKFSLALLHISWSSVRHQLKQQKQNHIVYFGQELLNIICIKQFICLNVHYLLNFITRESVIVNLQWLLKANK